MAADLQTFVISDHDDGFFNNARINLRHIETDPDLKRGFFFLLRFRARQDFDELALAGLSASLRDTGKAL